MSITEEILTGAKKSWRFPKTGKKKGSDRREKSKKLKEKRIVKKFKDAQSAVKVGVKFASKLPDT